MTIQVLHEQGMSARAIARELHLARQTVLNVLSGRSDGAYGPRQPRPTKLAPFHEFILQRLEQASPERIPATVLLLELQALGYDGGISQLKSYLAALRPPAPTPVIQRFETQPGEQMQIDFSIFRRGDRPLKAFTASLGFSRMNFVLFSDNERAETWAHGIEQACIAFGGVPLTILCDNSRSIVVQRNAYGLGQHRLHGLIWDLAKHYKIRIHLCRPYRAQTKGKIERFHRYMRESFFIPTLTRLGDMDVATANREVQIWLNHVANVRQHATLRERPIDRFKIERASLRPLPLTYSGTILHPNETLSNEIHVPYPTESFQHPLRTYDLFASEISS